MTQSASSRLSVRTGDFRFTVSPAAACRRNPVGVNPVSALNARLNSASNWNPPQATSPRLTTAADAAHTLRKDGARPQPKMTGKPMASATSGEFRPNDQLGSKGAVEIAWAAPDTPMAAPRLAAGRCRMDRNKYHANQEEKSDHRGADAEIGGPSTPSQPRSGSK
jgi:hypothetical protein